MCYTVGEIAKMLDISASTLRYYDKEGLLPFLERSASGIRVFHDKDIEWLGLIECLKKTGMSIRDIRMFMDWCRAGDDTIGLRLALITKQREAVEAQMQQLQRTLDMLAFKQWYYEKASEAGTSKVLDQIAYADVPEAYRKYLHSRQEASQPHKL